MSGPIEPSSRAEFSAAELVAAHPPAVEHPNKRTVLEVACPPGAVHAGRVGYTRWPAIPVPATLPHPEPGLLAVVPGHYDYRPFATGPDAVEWHVNFADPELFGSYAGPLLAQDELQVAEHPVLASLREALVARGVRPRTVGANAPTPILVTGAERRVALDLAPDAASGRPHGLYGQAFALATPDAVRAAARVVDPPTRTNLVAIAAPSGGHGPYRADEIRRALLTAYSGYRAAVAESERLVGGRPRAVVHTGHWGGGAFGGDRVLLATLQLLAARLAGLDRLVFHAAADPGPVEEARGVAAAIAEPGTAVETVVERLVGRGFAWGAPNGT